MGRGAIIAWMLTPQIFFTLMAVAITWGTIQISIHFKQTEGSYMGRILSLMGNMIALPQIILGFAMLNIFSYNSYQVHLMPLWIFASIIMGLGGITLGIFFTLTVRQIKMAGQGKTR